MKLKASFLASEIPFLRKLNPNSNILKIIKAFCSAFFISNSIYFSHFENFWLDLLSPFIAIYGFVLLLRMDGRGWFLTGFFVSLFWFYWISLSSVYYGLHYIIPFEILGIGLFYAVLFRLCYVFHFSFLRLGALFCLPFIHFLDFDWLNWGVLVVPGLFDASWRGIVCVFLIAYFWYERYISSYYKFVIILALFFTGVQYEDKKFETLQSEFKLINTNIAEDEKFLPEVMAKNADKIVDEILKAIEEKKELVIFPESSFAFDLKQGFGGIYYELLKEFSNEIDIVIGAPYEENGKFYNSAFIFQNGEVKILSKYHLVAFGEEMPKIPFISDFVRENLLANMGEFSRGERFNQYKIRSQLITNAICFEATKEELYKKSKIIIAISNNAWFDNFVEPALQKLLISFYASKYGVSVYHSTNARQTAVILPKKSLFLQLISFFDNKKDTKAVQSAVNIDENQSINSKNEQNDENLTHINEDNQTKELNF